MSRTVYTLQLAVDIEAQSAREAEAWLTDYINDSEEAAVLAVQTIGRVED